MYQNRAYWFRWAYLRGQHHYAERLYGSAAYECAVVSDDPELVAEAVRGWRDAEAAESTVTPKEGA